MPTAMAMMAQTPRIRLLAALLVARLSMAAMKQAAVMMMTNMVLLMVLIPSRGCVAVARRYRP